MNQVNSLLRQVLKFFLVVFAAFVVEVIGYSNLMQAQAETVTPEASSYKVEVTDTNIKKGSNPIEAIKENLKETTENIREKLNLDEPIDPGTKDFLNTVETKVEETVKPVTGTEKGYYQDNLLKK